MKKLLPLLTLLAGAALGALLLLAYGLAWQTLSRSLGFGLIVFGVSSPDTGLPIWNRPPIWSGVEGLPFVLWQQAHTFFGWPDALAGALLGWASVLLVLHTRGDGPAGLRGCDICRRICSGILFCVGVFGAMVLALAVLPNLIALVYHPESQGFAESHILTESYVPPLPLSSHLPVVRGFALQQFILIGVVCNPKLWWCAALWRWANRLSNATPEASPQVLAEAPA